MRNYVKYFVASGHYDDGFGGQIPITQFFESIKQRDDFLENATWLLNPVWNTYQHVWVLLNKRDLGTHLAAAYGDTEMSPEQFDPSVGFALQTPYLDGFNQWSQFADSLLSQYFHRADQDPLR